MEVLLGIFSFATMLLFFGFTWYFLGSIKADLEEIKKKLGGADIPDSVIEDLEKIKKNVGDIIE